MPYDLSITVDNSSGDYDKLLALTLAKEERGVNAAPFPVWFECTAISGCAATGPGAGTRDPQFHDIIYLWDFDDEANATPTTVLNIPTAWKNANIAGGRRAAHVFNDPGTYTVTCYAYEPATRRFGSKTISVTIADPASVFAGTQTIIFNPNSVTVSGFGYTGYTEINTNWAAVTTAWDAVDSNPCQVLIAPGVTLADTILSNGKDRPNIRIGGLDPDNKPTISFSSEATFLITDFSNSNAEVALFGIIFEAPWDSTTETGKVVSPFNLFRTGQTTPHNMMIHRCEWDGWRRVSGVSGSTSVKNSFIVSDTKITNWQDYGIFVGCEYIGIIGSSIFQHVDALSGGEKIGGFYNNHACFRGSEHDYLFMSVLDLFSRNGWSAGGTDSIRGHVVTYDQACSRANTNGAADSSSYQERISYEGAAWLTEQDSTGVDVPGNHIIDKAVFTLSSRHYYAAGPAIVATYGGTTVRNSLFIRLDIPTAHTQNTPYFALAENDDGSVGNDEAVQFYNNTFIDLRDDTSFGGSGTFTPFGTPTTAFTDFLAQNNIDHQPNRGTPVDDDAPIDVMTSIGITPRHKGPRYGFLYNEGTISGTISGSGGTFTIAYSVVKDTLYNYNKVNDGSATDQTYWTTYGGTKHKLLVNGTLYHAEDGDFSVTFGASDITITNNSGTDWTNAQAWDLKLDRSDALENFDAQYDATGETVPLARPQTGSAAIDDGDTGLAAYDDLLGTERPASGNESGALLTA